MSNEYGVLLGLVINNKIQDDIFIKPIDNGFIWQYFKEEKYSSFHGNIWEHGHFKANNISLY